MFYGFGFCQKNCAGVEVMEINVPVVIGSLPQRKLGGPRMLAPAKMPSASSTAPEGPQNTFTRAARDAAPSAHRAPMFRVGGNDEGEPQALFMQSRKDVTAKLGAPNEQYLCSKSQVGAKCKRTKQLERIETNLKFRTTNSAESHYIPF